MKKINRFIFILTCIFGLVGCNGNGFDSTAETEIVSTAYGKVIVLAKAEFSEIFKEYEDMKIEETSTMARTDDEKEIVVQIKYSSDNGNGMYGFVYNLEDDANPELIQHGEDITIDNLLK